MAELDTRAAKRYATALFDLCKREGKLETLTSDLQQARSVMTEHPALKEAWDSPLIPAARKQIIIDRVFSGGSDPLTVSFLRLLVDKRREEILDPALLELKQLVDADQHLLRADATFAVEPTPQQQDALADSLAKRTGAHIDLTVRVDPAILGGVIVRMRDTIIDGSVRGTLEKLREQLRQEV